MKDTLEAALRISGKALLQYFNRPLRIRRKESQSSIVTDADFTSDSIIKEIIRKEYPFHNILSEETGYQNLNSDFTWIIDPLDGTSNFAAGIPWFGILISVLQGNDPVLAGAYLPVSDIIYIAEKGKGAFRNSERLYIPDNMSLKNSLISFCIDYTDDDEFLKKGLDIYRFAVNNSRNLRSTNSLIDFLYVAEGKFGACVNLFTRIWDITSPYLLISEAGGIMTDINGNKLEFTMYETIGEKNFPVICGPEDLVRTISSVTLKETIC